MGRSAHLTRERIVAEALALLDAEGVSGLSMRRLAARLGVQAASLYHHISGQDDLIDAMHDQINAQVDLSLLQDLTPAGFAAFARSYRDAYLQHPDAVDLVSRRSITATGALIVYEAVADHLRRRGLPPGRLMTVLAVLDFVVLGSAGETLAADFHLDPDSYAPDYPNLAQALRLTDRSRVDDEAFELALESCAALIDRLSRSPRTQGSGPLSRK